MMFFQANLRLLEACHPEAWAVEWAEWIKAGIPRICFLDLMTNHKFND
jgi:hypothetical protein